MTLIINNDDVEQVLTMEDTIAALEQSYLAARRPGGGVPAAHRHPHSDQRSGAATTSGAPWRAARPAAISRSA